VIDFFDFNNSANGDSGDGSGRTCSNHNASTFSNLPYFYQWWYSQPRANFNSSENPTIEDALNDNTFPLYQPINTKWSVVNVGCNQVKFVATFPTSNLIANSSGDCIAVHHPAVIPFS